MAIALSNDPCAIRIVDINDGLLVDVESLRHVLLQENIKNKKVCVVSIAGAFRQGKSFLLNFFIRYLTITCKEKRDLKNWLHPKDGPVGGFSWRGGADTVTSGIWIWSEVFLVGLPSGEEVAVVLLDTQGSFDNETTMRNCAAIFALSTLISSVQIYNLKENIKSSDLEHLQFFLGYGKLLRESGNQVPFQNLLFLIRDWATPEQYPYGIMGGSCLLNKVLDTKGGSVDQELISLRKGITELFERISCFLLPHPGLEVTKLQFNGDLDVIQPDFKEQIQILATTVLSPKNLVPKFINGEPIRVKNLVTLFESYCQQFKSKDMPKVESLFMATAHTQHAMAIEETEFMYDNLMHFVRNPSLKGLEDEILREKHTQSKSSAIEFFCQKKMIGGEALKKESKAILEKKLEDKFKVYVNLNEIKLQKEREIELQAMYKKQQMKLVDLEDQVIEEKRIRDRMVKQHNESIRRQQDKVSDLEKQVAQEKQIREATVREHQESAKAQNEKIHSLEQNLIREQEQRNAMAKEHDELIKKQKKKLKELERKVEEENRKIVEVTRSDGSLLSEIDRSDDPPAKLVKGVLAVGYGLATTVDGVVSTFTGLFK